MHKEINHRIRKHFNEGIYNVARYTEIVLSIVILIVIALTGIRLIYTITEISVLDMDIDFFYRVSCKCTVACCGGGVCKNALPPFCTDSC